VAHCTIQPGRPRAARTRVRRAGVGNANAGPKLHARVRRRESVRDAVGGIRKVIHPTFMARSRSRSRGESTSTASVTTTTPPRSLRSHPFMAEGTRVTWSSNKQPGAASAAHHRRERAAGAAEILQHGI